MKFEIETEEVEASSLEETQNLKNVQKESGHGFTVHESLKDLHEYFTSDNLDDVFEPPVFHKKKPTGRDLKQSQGLI